MNGMVGASRPRVEDRALLTGQGRFVSDLAWPGATAGAVLRAPVAHGRIAALDAHAAREMPGILAVYTHAEIEGRLAPLANQFPLEPAPAPVSVPRLAGERVLFVGQPVAFVVAESREQALDAAEAIALDIEEDPAVTDPEAALAGGAPQLHEAAPGNVAYRWSCGDRAATDAAFARAAHVVRTRVLNQRLVVASLEPRAITVRYDPETARWDAWVGTQGAHGMRAKLAGALMVEPGRVRVRVPDVGGAFGMKLMDHPEYALAALAAKDLGRAVAWVGDRSESFLSDAQGRDMRADLEGAFDAEGRALAMRMRVVSGLGAYFSSFGAAVHGPFSAPLLGGMYAIEAMHAETVGAFTNTTPTDAYRGAGRPEVIHATERLMERAAREIGLDPVEIRRRNLLTPDRVPHRTPGGMVFDSLDCPAVLDRALAAADHAGFTARAQDAAARGRQAGIGVAYYMERTGGGPMEQTRVEIGAEGGTKVWIGTQASGQGHATAWGQILGGALGLDPAGITLMEGDSDALPVGGGTGGSRSAKMASRVLLLAAEEIIAKARSLASAHLEAAEGDLDFEPVAGGCFRIAGTDRVVGLGALAAGAGGITGEGAVDGRESTYPNGCHIAEVEIDRETGALALTRYTIADDMGRLINPMLVAGQIHGGVAQGVGQVLGEHMLWDEAGQPLTASFMDYRMPRAADFPGIALDFVEVPATTNPLGVKGCGEAGSVAAIPALTLAVLDALDRAGVAEPDRIEPPYTPERLWRALRRL